MYCIDTYEHLTEAGVAGFSAECESQQDLKKIAQEVIDYGLSLSEVHVLKYDSETDDYDDLGSLEENL